MYSLKNNILMQKWFFAVLSCIAIISYLHYVQKYGVNLPLWDDYDSGLNFLLDWKAALSFHDKWVVLLHQHVEHRIVLTKLLEISSYRIFGQINFKYLIWWANIFLFSILFFMSFWVMRSLVDNRHKMPVFLIITSLVLLPVQTQSQLSGMVGIEAFGQIFCSLLIFYVFLKYLDAPSQHAIFLLMLLNFINIFIGGGFIALFITLPIMALIFKRAKFSLFLLLYFAALTLLYFKITPYTFFTYSIAPIKADIIFFFRFLGGGLQRFGHYASFGFGALLFLVIIFYRKELQKNKFVFCWLFFVLVTDLLLVKTRAGLATGDSSRYTTYSLITMILVISTLLFPRLSNKALNWLAVACFCVFIFCLKSGEIYAYPKAKKEVFYPNVPVAIMTYEKAKSEGIYSSAYLEAIIRKSAPQQKP